MEKEKLIEILNCFKNKRIAIIGDPFLDRYCITNIEKATISREAPHHNRPVISNIFSPGGAGNVAWNLKDIGIKEVYIIGVIGEDYFGEILNKELKKRGINTDYLISSSERRTCTYEKFLRQALGNIQEDPRVDTENYERMGDKLEKQIISNVKTCLKEIDAFIIIDQVEADNLGVITDKVREEIIKLAKNNSDKLFICNSRKRISKFSDMIAVMNEIELIKALNPNAEINKSDVKNIMNYGKDLFKRFGKPIYITRGENGAIVLKEDNHIHIKAVQVSPPIDITGAGDTFISALVAALCSKAKHEEAAEIGNLAASITIKKIGMTGTATPEEILEQYSKLKNE